MKPDDLRALRDDAPPAPAGLADSVVRRAALLGRPRKASWLFGERKVALPLRALVLTGAAAIAVAALFVVRHDRPAPTAQTPPADPPGVLVRFALPAPDAHEVYLTGDFNGWSAERTPLRRSRDGVWVAMVPLRAGTFEYSYIVDGRFVPDPLADTFRPDGFGGTNAVLRVGAAADPG